MADRALKWRVVKAVMASQLAAPARHLMHVFCDLADARTGVIPEPQTPSLADLARMTGMSEATVKRHKGDLEELGWLLYRRPTHAQMALHDTGRYAVRLGGSQRAPENGTPGAHSEPPNKKAGGRAKPKAGAHSEPPEGVSGAHGEPATGAHSEPPNENPGAQTEPPNGLSGAHSELFGGSQRADPGAHSEPPIYKDDSLRRPYDRSTAPHGTVGEVVPRTPGSHQTRTADPGNKIRRQQAEVIVKWWWDGLETKPVGEKAWHVAVSTIAACLKSGYDPRDVAEALVVSGSPVTAARMEIQLKRANGTNAPAQSAARRHLENGAAIAAQMRALDQAEANGQHIPNTFELPPGNRP